MNDDYQNIGMSNLIDLTACTSGDFTLSVKVITRLIQCNDLTPALSIDMQFFYHHTLGSLTQA